MAGVVLARFNFFNEFGWANQSDREAIPSGPSVLFDTSNAANKDILKSLSSGNNINKKRPELVKVAEMCRFLFKAVEREGTA